MKEAELANMLAHMVAAILGTTQCLNKQLWYDYVQFCKEAAALCSNDAKVVMIILFCLWWHCVCVS